MVPIDRCAWSAQKAEESFGCATMEGCARSNRRLRSNLPRREQGGYFVADTAAGGGMAGAAGGT